METPALLKTFNNLPPHWSLAVRFDLLLFKSVDYEKVSILMDGNNQGTYTKGISDGYDICDSAEKYKDQLYFFQKNITHSKPILAFQISSNFDQDNNDEGYGIRNFSIRVDTCHPTCASCSGPTANQCLTCPQGSKYNNGKCVCQSNTIGHSHACINQCPQGFIQDTTNTFCIESSCNPSKCLSCSQNKLKCETCQKDYFLFENNCILQCPSFAPNNGSICNSPTPKTQYGKLVFQGLTFNTFGESEISSLGLQVTGFNQASFSNCGGQQLVGGSQIGQNGFKVKKNFQLLEPHYQIRFGFSYILIDSVSEESGFKVNVNQKQIDFVKSYTIGISQDLCGSHSRFEKAGQYSKTISHNSTSFEVEVVANLNSSQESFGLRDIFVILDRCSNGCTSCDQNNCLICSQGYQLIDGKCSELCEKDEFSVDQRCQKCDSSCNSCIETATNCTSCSQGTFLMKNQCLRTCPDNYYDNTKLNICSQCSQSECPKCISKGYISQCKDCTGFKIISNKC